MKPECATWNERSPRSCRKLARRKAENKSVPQRITAESLNKYLGPPQFLSTLSEETDEIGVATGLAWTEGGGDIMPIEVTIMPGKGSVQLTGQLGDVMQESGAGGVEFHTLAGNAAWH